MLDSYLAERALELNKVVAGVETAAEQCAALNSLPDTAAASVLNETLYDLERLMRGSESLFLAEMAKITQDYICGRNELTVLPTTTPEEVQRGDEVKNLFFFISKTFQQRSGWRKSYLLRGTR